MYKVEQLYIIFDDGNGHRHLIPKEYYKAFEEQIERIDEAFSEHKDEDVYYEQVDDLLDHFSNHRLEGESCYVVLEEHVIENNEPEF